MNKNYFLPCIYSFIIFFGLSVLTVGTSMAQKVHTSYLWHMDQPVYWADKSKDKPDSKQFAEESHRLKMSGSNMYPGSAAAHPTNNLEEIFGKADRVQAYQYVPRDAVNSIRDLPNAGAQLSISAGLLENMQSLGAKNQWGYTAGWMNAYKDAIAWKTGGNLPRLDVVTFTYDHALSPLVSERTLIKQIKAHQYVSNKYYGYTSKGYWPAECAFSERIIKALVSCGVEWSVVPNSHLARTLADYVHPYNINGNSDEPNRADRVSTNGVNWFDGVIDGRGSRLAAPYCYQAHKAQYIDPTTGTASVIDVVPMCNYISYIDGYGTHGTSEIATNIEPFSNSSHPSLVLMAHDGDNAWGGGSSYYNESVTGFTHAAASAGYEPSTIQQFLKDHPVPADDVVHVEDGAWVNADSDWGHPQFINWLWPLYSKTNYRFDPDGWTEDARNWAVITATDNYVTMAEDLEGGNLRIGYIADGGSDATNAEKAWHFYFGGLNSGFMYYGKAEDMEVKASMTGNIAIDYANRVISANSGTDNTAPSVFIPQRFPYNPGGYAFGPITGYKKTALSSDFHVWTFAYDVSGLSSVTLKYRLDADGSNPVSSIQNETYAGGPEVEAWQETAMTRRAMAPDPTTDAELNFFIQPAAKADLCYAEITGLKDKLVDYYVEAVDTKGNVYKSPIQHVYVGTGDGQTPSGGDVSWTPASPNATETIIVSCKNATAASKLHWGVNTWSAPNAVYQPTGTVAISDKAVETPFQLVNGVWQVNLGPFNNPAQNVTSINFVINHGNNVWDNNNGSDYLITVKAAQTNNPTGNNISKTLNISTAYTFTQSDFGFNSTVGNAFKGIKIVSLPGAGYLTSGGTAATVNQVVSNVGELVYTAAGTNASFSYRIVDSADLLSDAVYVASFTVTDPTSTAIRVSFKRPADWGNTPVYLWAWTVSGNLFASWPGVTMTESSSGCFSYTFDKLVNNVNVIFSKNGTPQSVDITGITQSTCFEYDAASGNKFTVKNTACETTSVSHIVVQEVSVYPQPAKSRFYITLPNTGNCKTYYLNLIDLSGRIVKTDHFIGQTTAVDCSSVKAGVYFVKIISGDGKEIYTSKLIKSL
ncbi:MAG TPA: starch-binding protein [Paludibacteraceae bacterium]|nr:starch-binding protein [Paludibacteraceae bacterium]